VIYHFCPRTEWEAASATGSYTADSLATQGFIHCSPRHHVHESATIRARGRTDLVVLEVDEDRLPEPAVWEEGDPPHPTGMLFPHVYGPIPVTAVVAVQNLLPGPDGSFAPLG
jgi:uncharacterized protein (DUF952 family)